MPMLRCKPAARELNTPDPSILSSRQQLCVIVEANSQGLLGVSLLTQHTPGSLFSKLSHPVREKILGRESELAWSEIFLHFWPY